MPHIQTSLSLIENLHAKEGGKEKTSPWQLPHKSTGYQNFLQEKAMHLLYCKLVH